MYLAHNHRSEEAGSELADILNLQDTIVQITSWEQIGDWRSEMRDFAKIRRINAERGTVWKGIREALATWNGTGNEVQQKMPQESLDPNIFARNTRLKTVSFDISTRAREIVLSRMQQYMEYKNKVGVQDFELSEDGKILRFSYLWSPISIIWKWWKKYEYLGKQFHEIEETLLTNFGLGYMEEDVSRNKKYALAPNVAVKLGLSSESYICTLEHERKTGSHTGVLVRASDMPAYTTPPEVEREDLSSLWKMLHAHSQHETIKKRLEMRISDFYLRVFQASQKQTNK